MVRPEITEVRLKAFKSFIDQTLPLGPVTTLIGRNSSGKSNALDGLDVLSRLASGEELTDALDGRNSQRGPVRSGSRGLAPHGTTQFSIGCTVASGDDTYIYDVTVDVEPTLTIHHERLTGPQGSLLYEVSGREETGLTVTVTSQKQGPNPTYTFRDSRLILSQIPLRFGDDNATFQDLTTGAVAVDTALRSVFIADPIPSLMRAYVPRHDYELRRSGENLSAALAHLRETAPDAFAIVEDVARSVADGNVDGLSIAQSDLDDVMLTLREHFTTSSAPTPARELSDGLLRMLAIATALQSGPNLLDITQPATSAHLIIEEIDNGLHPAQIATVRELVDNSYRQFGTRTLMTTHNPALLDQIDTATVVVSYRDTTSGHSKLTRLIHLPDFTRELAQRSLGQAVTAGKLLDDSMAANDFTALNELLGI